MMIVMWRFLLPPVTGSISHLGYKVQHFLTEIKQHYNTGRHGNIENHYLLPPEILQAGRKLKSVLRSEVSLIGRGLLLTVVSPGKHTDTSAAGRLRLQSRYILCSPARVKYTRPLQLLLQHGCAEETAWTFSLQGVC